MPTNSMVMRLSCTQEGKESCFSGGGENVVQAEAESSAAALTRSEPPFRPQAAKTGGGGWWLSRALWYFVNRSRECRLTSDVCALSSSSALSLYAIPGRTQLVTLFLHTL
ncbi:hypothetical protein TEQG_05538 [Trichophyton equinum CBS 127.97]|uniref:Uncharacterized protein n=1 Tax=Trichophyton equinum (strain ATCC MYA-4606 / CBS 127.97) TaxID=559882 RepID=F2PXC0_TRIEC|nr:hypothetical protein TEQG_05538 [Trichophyton equinum CBS 127.97]